MAYLSDDCVTTFLNSAHPQTTYEFMHADTSVHVEIDGIREKATRHGLRARFTQCPPEVPGMTIICVTLDKPPAPRNALPT